MIVGIVVKVTAPDPSSVRLLNVVTEDPLIIGVAPFKITVPTASLKVPLLDQFPKTVKLGVVPAKLKVALGLMVMLLQSAAAEVMIGE